MSRGSVDFRLIMTRCHPRYLGVKAHAKLSREGAFEGLRIHTDEINEVIARLTPSTVSIAVVCLSFYVKLLLADSFKLMDSMDWFEPLTNAAAVQIIAMNKVLRPGGRVLLRSAALVPWYIQIFEEHGFLCTCVGKRIPGTCIDRYERSIVLPIIP